MKRIIILLFCSCIFIAGCKTADTVIQPGSDTGIRLNDTVEPDTVVEVPEETETYKKPEAFNLRLVIRTINAEGELAARKTYYRVFIDGTEQGRTTIGEEIQEKSFEAYVPAENHTITVEKYVLDERRGKYVKLKNIEQPKPDSYTVELPEDRILNLSFEEDGATAEGIFSASFEKE